MQKVLILLSVILVCACTRSEKEREMTGTRPTLIKENASSFSSTQQSVTPNIAGPANSLKLEGPATISSNMCSLVFTVTGIDANLGGSQPFAPGRVFTISGLEVGSVFLDASCANPAASSTISATGNSNQIQFYLRAPTAGSKMLKVQTPDISSTLMPLLVQEGLKPSLSIVGPSGPIFSDTCVAISIKTLAPFGGPYPVPADLVVNIAASIPGVRYFSDNDCAMPIANSQVTISRNASGALIYTVLPEGSGTFSLAVSALLFQPASALLTVSSRTAKIEAGFFHTCVLKNGRVKCSGYNAFGMVGSGAPASFRLLPETVVGMDYGVTALASGYAHSCAVKNGEVFCWGLNSTGQLGDGTQVSRFTPVKVAGLPPGATDVAAGWGHTCAIVAGEAWCWGSNALKQLGVDSVLGLSRVPVRTGIRALSRVVSHFYHNCAATLNRDSVVCWGYNALGQLGVPSTTKVVSAAPQLVSGLPYSANPGVANLTLASPYIVDIAVGAYHSCAIVRNTGPANDGAYCWGYNGLGQLGDGTHVTRPTPRKVAALGPNVSAIGSGFYQSCAVADGAAYCWGFNGHGALGSGIFSAYSVVPVKVPTLSYGVSAVNGGTYHTCFQKNESIYCAGYGAHGQFGSGGTGISSTPVLTAF